MVLYFQICLASKPVRSAKFQGKGLYKISPLPSLSLCCFKGVTMHLRATMPVSTICNSRLQIRDNCSVCFWTPPNRRRQGLQKSPSCLFEFRSLRQEQLANKLQTTRHVQTITADFPAPGLAFLYQLSAPSPPWLLKFFYLHVSCPSEY